MEVVPAIAPPSTSGSDSALQRTLHPVVLEFESSGRWPEEPAAARKVAGALLLQIREELASDLGIESDATEDFLDVRYPEAVFRLRIFHPHELRGAAERVTNIQAPVGSTPPNPENVDRLRALWWRPAVRPLLHSHALQQPPLAGAVRLCKRWMASQALSGYDEFVEHLVAAAFLHPAPFETPTSPQVGFCRFCRLLDDFDWEHEPLILDLDGKLTDEERLGLRQSFERRHHDEKTAASGGLWLVTRFDPHALMLETPPATVAAWLRRRAQLALAACHRRVLGLGLQGSPSTAASWKPVFELDVTSFDLILQLLPLPKVDAESLAHPAPIGDLSAFAEEGDEKEANPAKGRKTRLAAATKRREIAQLVSREAAERLVQNLRDNLSPICLVLHDVQNQLVAVKWRPTAFVPQNQNVLMGSIPHTMIQTSGQPLLCVPNILCLTSTIASLAQGLCLEANVIVPQA